MKELLSDFPVVVETPVIWGDMDAYEHVNNTVYFRYFEDARIAYLEKLKFNEFKKEKGIGPILASTQCRFKVPLTYPDTVLIGARIIDVHADRFTMLYKVVSEKYKKVAAQGEGLLVAYDYNAMAKVKLPGVICDRIKRIEGGC